MRIARFATGIVLLLVLAFAFFVAYSHALPYLQAWLPPSSDESRLLVVLRAGAQGALLAVGCAAFFALPFAWLYGRFAHWAALACVLPTVATIVQAALPRSATMSATMHGVVAWFALCLLVCVPWAAQRVHRLLLARRPAP